MCKYGSMSTDAKKGAAKALNITITAIMEHLGDDSRRPPNNLREFLYKIIGDLVEDRYKKGFRRGHRESHKQFQKHRKVPNVLQYKCSRELSPGQKRDIVLKSTITKPRKKAGRKKRP